MAQLCAGWRKALPEEACYLIVQGHEVCEHMQVFCGMLARIAQFADIMVDAKQQIDKVMTQPLLDPQGNTRHASANQFRCDVALT